MRLAFDAALGEHVPFCAHCDCSILLHAIQWYESNTIKITFCKNCKCAQFKKDR